MSLQTAYNEGATISQAALDTKINITQSDTTASNYLLQISNSGGGRGLQVDNNGASYALVLRQFGAGHCVAIGQKSTSLHNVLELENSGSGKTVQILQSTGSGNVMDITDQGTGMSLNITKYGSTGDVIVIGNSGSGTDLKIYHPASTFNYIVDINSYGNNDILHIANNGTHASAGSIVLDHNNPNASAIYIDSDNTSATYADIVLNHASTAGSCINIISSNSGYQQISGRPTAGAADTWGVDCQGDAGFNSVTSVSQVYAPNTAIAGGRVLIYLEREGEEPTITYKTFCDWGLYFENPISYTVLNPWNYQALVGVTLAMPVQCPVINITPWMGGQYDVDDDTGLFGNGPTALPGAGSMSLDANLIAITPAQGIQCEGGASIFWFEVTYNSVSTPALHGEYIVGLDPDAQGQYLDLLFDFTVTGMYCPIEP